MPGRCLLRALALMSLMQGMYSTEGGLSSNNDERTWHIGARCGLNAPVDEAVIEGGRVTGVRASNGFVAAGRVILTVDAKAALQVTPDLPSVMAEPFMGKDEASSASCGNGCKAASCHAVCRPCECNVQSVNQKRGIMGAHLLSHGDVGGVREIP